MMYMMKHSLTKAILLALALCLLPWAALASEAGIGWEAQETTGPAGSFVRWPLFAAQDAALADTAEKINQAIQEQVRLQAYQALLATVSEGSTGVQVDYEMALGKDYLSILFSAEGKMLAGRPGQVYYPMTFDLATGESIAFDALFADPDGAKAFIEEYLADEVAPTLSTYLENNQLFPVPYDRFFLDGCGNLIFCYEAGQLSFLSGFSGTVAFRYSELWNYLDHSADGIPMGVMLQGDNENRYPPARQDFSLGEAMDEWVGSGRLSGLVSAPRLTDPLDEALSRLRVAADSGYYPGGAYYEAEDARLRGTLILTNDDETLVTGLLTARVDQYGIETGRTPLDEAEEMLGWAGGIRIPMDGAVAEMYHICPGTALVYMRSLQDADDANDPCHGAPVSFTLYADEEGVVQYIRISIEK